MDFVTENINQLYKALVNSSEFDEIELELSKPNIFNILKITKNEIRHSNFLAWLLSPSESHRLGSIFLRRFLREASSHDLSNNIDPVDIGSLSSGKAMIYREWHHIDLLMEFDDFVVCIENKLLSVDHSDQLRRYQQRVEEYFPNHRKLYIYLTPDGSEPNQLLNTYIPISYEFVANTLQEVVDIYNDELSQKVKHLIYDYISTLRTDIMGTNETAELAKKIYKNHKEILDFIFEHKPDVLDDVKDAFIYEIQRMGWIPGSTTKSYTRFTTSEIKKVTYINSLPNSWTNRESFLFELIHESNKNVLTLKFVISPCDAAYDNYAVAELFGSLAPPFKIPSGKKWLTVIAPF
jgi:hypothetical protein